MFNLNLRPTRVVRLANINGTHRVPFMASMLLSLFLATVSASHAPAQCADWIPTFGGLPGFGDPVSGLHLSALVVFDDGTGPALYVGGDFRVVAGRSMRGVAKWDGEQWSPLGSGVTQTTALTVFDDGTGPALYAGSRRGVHKWDGAAWVAVGGDLAGSGTVYELAVFQDALYAGGDFTSVGGLIANRLAKWDGVAWSPVGGGVSGDFFPNVSALAVYDDGSGPSLYVGGRFTSAGGLAASNVAKWNGDGWSTLGSGVNGSVRALVAFDAGSGLALYAGGYFPSADGFSANGVAKWDGAGWSPLGFGVDSAVAALAGFDDGTGAALYASGYFENPSGLGGLGGIAKWDGTAWTIVGGGLSWPGSTGGGAYTLAVFDDGSGAGLYVGGRFNHAGAVRVHNLAKWDGTAWSALSTGLNDAVYCTVVADDAAGSALYAGGYFTSAGESPANRVVRWDGTSWSALSTGFDNGVRAMAASPAGSTPALYAGGAFTSAGGIPMNHIAQWDGAVWAPLGSGVDRDVLALTIFDDGSGPALYAGGFFMRAGGTTVNRVAKWDGAAWSSMSSGFDSVVNALASFDDGTGPALYAAGSFLHAGTTLVRGVAKWNGTAWSPLGEGIYWRPDDPIGKVESIAVFDDGTGSALYAGGHFDARFGGRDAEGIAKWDGVSWSAVGTGFRHDVNALTVYDDGVGPALFAALITPFSSGLSTTRLLKWDGGLWLPLGSGFDRDMLTLTVFDDGRGAAMYAGGIFTISPSGDSYLARYGCLNQPTCLAELTNAPPVDVFDLLAYLNLWFASSPDAERTGDDPAAIDVFDLLEYLNVWFPESAAGCS